MADYVTMTRLTFLCWQLANIHGFVEDFDSQSQRRWQRHLSFFVVLLQHGHGSLRARSQSIKDQTQNRKPPGCTQTQCVFGLLYVQLNFRRQTRWNNLIFNCVHTTVKNNKLFFKNLSPTVNPDSQRYCCRYRLPSSLRSCHWGRSDTAGNHNVCPSPCRAGKHQMVSSLSGCTKNKWKIHNVTLIPNMRLFGGWGAPYLQTVCRPAWCHIKQSPAAHRESAPGTGVNIWRTKKTAIIQTKEKTFLGECTPLPFPPYCDLYLHNIVYKPYIGSINTRLHISRSFVIEVP